MKDEELPAVAALSPDDDATGIRSFARHRQAVPGRLHLRHEPRPYWRKTTARGLPGAGAEGEER